MKCPRCLHEETKVVDSRSHGSAIKRRRSCLNCLHRFTTFERIERKVPMVRKKNGGLEHFDSNKIRLGLENAFRKRSIDAARFEKLIFDIESHIAAQLVDEIPSNDIGELILSKIQGIDMIAYLRFASVYRNVQTVEAFVALLPK